MIENNIDLSNLVYEKILTMEDIQDENLVYLHRNIENVCNRIFGKYSSENQIKYLKIKLFLNGKHIVSKWKELKLFYISRYLDFIQEQLFQILLYIQEMKESNDELYEKYANVSTVGDSILIHYLFNFSLEKSNRYQFDNKEWLEKLYYRYFFNYKTFELILKNRSGKIASPEDIQRFKDHFKKYSISFKHLSEIIKLYVLNYEMSKAITRIKSNKQSQEQNFIIERDKNGGISFHMAKTEWSGFLYDLGIHAREKAINEGWTYKKGYEWAANTYTKSGKKLTPMQIEKAYYKKYSI